MKDFALKAELEARLAEAPNPGAERDALRNALYEVEARIERAEREQEFAPDFGGAFDGFTVTSDADPGL